ncbi:unnamed protein product [Miscanthus lutarioriparius]|uniref:CCHC-type domain-containing protein n=1 Tax=Miscanthus lutarioriparius TaxID=422564 RepID=A0A811SFM2_9POAL|nr:unnamed protein product [Miscanthus lutarioriparius]
MWLMLTSDNYTEWAMLMQCNYEALEIWGVIDPGTDPKRAQDRQAMSALLRSVPKEMWQSLGRKKTVKEAWEAAGRLLLAEDDWLEKHKHRFHPGPKQGGGKFGSGSSKGKAAARPDGGAPDQVKLTSMGTPRRKGRCRNCGIYGHWVEDCKRPKKEKKEAAQPEENIAVGGAEHGGALLLATCDVVHEPTQIVHLMEKVIPIDVPDGVWVLDTGASNHMTGTRSVLTQLDRSVLGTMRFGDGSRVEIEGISSVVIQGRHQLSHKVLTDVYYIPKLRSNIVSLGQLEEKGFKVVLENGKMCVYDQGRALLISAPRTTNRL